MLTGIDQCHPCRDHVKGDTVHTEEPITESGKEPNKPAKTPRRGWRRHVKPVVIICLVGGAYELGMSMVDSMPDGPARKGGEVLVPALFLCAILVLWHWMTRKAEAASGKQILMARVLFWVILLFGGLLILSPVILDIIRFVLVHVRR